MKKPLFLTIQRKYDIIGRRLNSFDYNLIQSTMLERTQKLGIVGRLSLWIGIGVAGTLLATSVVRGDNLTVENFNALENARVIKVKAAYNDFLILANREYCLPRQIDLLKKIGIKKALGEEAGELESERKVLLTKEGCTRAIESVVFPLTK